MTLDKEGQRTAAGISEEMADQLENLGSVIKGTRQRAGLTQREAAKAIGIHHMTLYKIESGVKRTRADKLERMAAVFAPLIGETVGRVYRQFVDQAGEAIGVEPGEQRRRSVDDDEYE